jgi:quercetin dioxygenase-like cupin family protein
MATSEVATAEPIRPLDLIAYQDAAVVSRILLKRPAGTLTLFAFDEEQSLSEHTSPYDAVAQVLEGEAEITISGKSTSLGTGELIVLPANRPHAVRAKTRFKMLLTMIRSAS